MTGPDTGSGAGPGTHTSSDADTGTGSGTDTGTGIAPAVEQVRARIASAASAAGRAPDDVTLIAVTKTVPIERIREAVAAGVHDLGENRAQDLLAKQPALHGPGVRWHFIGTLQRNKIGSVLGRAALIHSVDSLGLAEAIARRATGLGEQVRILLQVNTTAEPTKHGVAPDLAEAMADAIRSLPGIALDGLMTIGPADRSADAARRSFAALRELRDRLALQVLSMGMSGDFELAVAEGATHVRVGTAIFGPRPAAVPTDATDEEEQGTNG